MQSTHRILGVVDILVHHERRPARVWFVTDADLVVAVAEAVVEVMEASAAEASAGKKTKQKKQKGSSD